MKKIFCILIFLNIKNLCYSIDLSIQGVRFFAYQLQNIELPENIEKLSLSNYDLLILDQVRSIKGMENYNSKADVIKLHNSYGSSVNPKKVISYINIGEAEDYRYYWQEGWKVGNPNWILAPDPDGWSGNYPVKFWDSQWKNIIKDYLRRIIEDGYDGAYFDWIEIYSFKPVVELAESEGKNSETEIILFLRELKEYSKNLNPNFIFIAQNASELGKNPEWLEVFSGIGQEGIWFTWGGDPDTGEEPGDVPVDAELSEEILSNLKKWKNAGKIVLDIEYAQERNNVNLAYSKGKENGFITYVTLSGLDELSSTPPLDYGLFNLTKNIDGDSANPAFSPDSNKILFSKSNGGAQNLMILDLANNSLKKLIDDSEHNYVNMPGSSWNKTLNKITFSSDLSGNDEIWTIKPDGSEIFKITNNISSDWEPTFSPLGEWIVFQSSRDGNWEIYKQNLSTNELIRLTYDTSDDWEPNWSPKGDLIVFQSNRTGNWDIWTMDINGQNLRNITNNPAEDTDPSFSPDGRWIVYSTDRDALDAEIHLVSVENPSFDFRLTFNNSYEGAPSISQDGKTLAFESNFSNELDIWSMPINLPTTRIHSRPF